MVFKRAGFESSFVMIIVMKKESYERITSRTYDGESQNPVWIDFGDELNFSTEIEDGDYFVYLHESNFNLSRKVQAELMERKEFQAVWWESGRGEGLGDFGEEDPE